VQNIGDTDMQFFSVFRTSNFQEFSLSDWLKGTSNNDDFVVGSPAAVA
jgi:oxalate decarboxylase/phosphoglucose isomerase-like protein (cupin superfamily)